MNVLHHLDKPVAFFEEARRILKPGGKLILFEPYASVTFKLALQIVGHEHCNDSADIFSETYSLNTEARNFWDGNNSTAKILFRDVTKFSERFPDFEITHRSFAELFIFLNSGGVYTNTFHIPVPLWFNRFKHKTDKMLIKISPDMFALAIRLVLQKKA